MIIMTNNNDNRKLVSSLSLLLLLLLCSLLHQVVVGRAMSAFGEQAMEAAAAVSREVACIGAVYIYIYA